MDFEDEEEKKAVKGQKFPIQMYISEGNYYFQLGKCDLAIEFFNKGLENELANIKCLIGRSKCYMRLAKYTEAREDAEAVLKSHPNSSDAKMLKGEADYFLGDFEKAFLTFHRGYSFRRNNDGLRCGYQMCEKAIENSLNPDVPIVIDEEDLRNVYELREDVEQPSKRGQYSADIDFVTSLLKDDSNELIKRIDHSKELFQREDDDSKDLFKRTIETVQENCEFVKDYLTDRQMFWHTQNPKTLKKCTSNSIFGDMGGAAENNIHGRDDETLFSESELKPPKKVSIESILKNLIESVEESTESSIRESDSDLAHEKVSFSESNLDASKSNTTDCIVADAEDYTNKSDSYAASEETLSSGSNLEAPQNSNADSVVEDAENYTHKPDSYIENEEILECNLDGSENKSADFIVENTEDNICNVDSSVPEEEDPSKKSNSNISKMSSTDTSTKSTEENIYESD